MLYRTDSAIIQAARCAGLLIAMLEEVHGQDVIRGVATASLSEAACRRL